MLQMNIGASEWGIIILLVVVLLIGSNRFSGLVRLMGRAVGEYEKAKEMIRNEDTYTPSVSGTFPSPIDMPEIKGPVNSEREKLTIIARALNIDYSELSDNELRSIISRKIQER